jgi:glycosyltransferase involved in cell wall biosynthesis
MNNDFVSIYLPTFNRCELLRRAVYSVLAQTYENWELIIVDDRSTDGTREFLETLQKLDHRIKCVFKSDTDTLAGVQSSRNIAINLAKGKYITGLDDDDFFHPERLTKLKAAYDPSLAFVSSNYFRYSKGRAKINSNLGRRITMKHLAIRNIVGNQVLTETKKFIAAGLFDEAMKSSQDLDLWFRLIKMFGPAKRIADHLYYHDVGHQHDRISLGTSSLEGDMQLLEKHHDVISGLAKKFKVDRLSVTRFGRGQGIVHSLRTYGLDVTCERLRTKFGLG